MEKEIQSEIHNEEKEEKFVFDFFDSKKRVLFLLFILIAIIFGKTISYKYSPIDDPSLIRDKIGWLQNWTNADDAFKQGVFFSEKDQGMYYRPLLTLSFMIDAKLGKGYPGFFHFMNILYHLLACYLFYIFLLLVFQNRNIAWLAALIFAVHPAIVHAVAWIPGRNDSLLAIFVLLSMTSFHRYFMNPNRKDLIYLIIFYLLALFTKENAVILPVIFLFYLFKNFKEKAKSVLTVAGVTLLLAFLFMLLRQNFTSSKSPIEVLSFGAMLKDSLFAFLIYLGKTVLPVNFSILPNILDSSIIPGFVILFAGGIIAYRFRRSLSKIGILGFILFIFTLIPAILMTSISNTQIHYEHRLYFPLMGFIIFSADILKNIRYSALAVLGAVFIFAIVSFVRTDNYKNSVKFSQASVREAPSQATAYNMMGLEYFYHKKYDKSLEMYNMALAKDPKYIRALFNKGVLLVEMKKYTEAIESLHLGFKIDSTNGGALLTMGKAYNGIKDNENALKFLNKAILNSPKYADAYITRALIFEELSQNAKAVEDYEKAILLNPQNADNYNNRANQYMALGEHQKAISDYNKAIEINPANKNYKSNLFLAKKQIQNTIKPKEELDLNDLEKNLLPQGLAFFQKKKYADAREVFKVLIEDAVKTKRKKNKISHLNNYALCFYRERNYPEAEKIFKTIIQQDSTYYKAYNNLGLIAKAKKNKDLAIQYFNKVLVFDPDNLKAKKEISLLKGNEFNDNVFDDLQ